MKKYRKTLIILLGGILLLALSTLFVTGTVPADSGELYNGIPEFTGRFETDHSLRGLPFWFWETYSFQPANVLIPIYTARINFINLLIDMSLYLLISFGMYTLIDGIRNAKKS